MNDDELNDLAIEAGIYWVSDNTAYMHPDTMRKFADAIAAKERERCAMAVVDYSLSYSFNESDRSLFAECAQYVRDGGLVVEEIL